MTSAARLYRLNVALAALGATVVAAAAVAAAGSVSFAPATTGAMEDVCERLLGVHVAVGPALAMFLAALVALSIGRAVAAGARELRAQRRSRAVLAASRPRRRADGAFVVDGAEALAFCAGLVRPRVYVTTGAIDALTLDQLHAVLAHEDHHRRRRDPMRLVTLRVLAEAFYFLPALAASAERYAALAEVAADAAAVRNAGRPAVAGALIAFAPSPDAASTIRLDPERVDHLMGRSPGLRLQLPLLLGSVASGVAIALGAASTAAAGPTLDVPRLAADSSAAATTLALPIAWFAMLARSRRRRAPAGRSFG